MATTKYNDGDDLDGPLANARTQLVIDGLLLPTFALLTRSTTFTIVDGGTTLWNVCTWTAATRNQGGGWNSGSNPSRWTCPVGQDGMFHVIAWGGMNNAGTVGAQRSFTLRKNGNNSDLWATYQQSYVSGIQPYVPITESIPMVGGDYLEYCMQQFSGGASISSSVGNGPTRMSVLRISD